MKKYNPDKHKRRSIRLKGYDYSREGLYFITICCQNRAHYFGEIINEEMQLNEIGEIAQKCWRDIPNHFKNVLLHTFVVMPNHIHGIIEIVIPVGANQHLPDNETANYHLPYNKGEKYFAPTNQHLPDNNRAKDISPQQINICPIIIGRKIFRPYGGHQTPLVPSCVVLKLV
ncbi:transposase [Capnocytophaga canis]|uniref:transposase n=1 Tax=Capnocytophaga canis TaxID=1848903 RepID=UPI0037D7326A